MMLFIMPSYGAAESGERTNQLGTTFFSVLNDIPLMPGLVEIADESVNFDKPEGRIIKATAVGEGLSSAQVQAFYEKTLPQLGWQQQKSGLFVREREYLSLNVHMKEGVSVLRLWIEPR